MPTLKLLENLIIQAREGDLDGVRQSLDKGAYCRYRDYAAFKTAARGGHYEIVSLFLEHIDTSTRNARIALAASVNKAAMYNEIKTVSVLLPHIHGSYCTNALAGAAIKGNLTIIKQLVEHGVDINATDSQAIRTSAESGHYDIFVYLLNNRANWKASNNFIMKCCGLQFVQHLVAECGADPNLSIHSNRSPNNVKEWCVKYLTSRKMNAKLSDSLQTEQEHIATRPVKL